MYKDPENVIYSQRMLIPSSERYKDPGIYKDPGNIIYSPRMLIHSLEMYKDPEDII